jgi:hypothetical protein
MGYRKFNKDAYDAFDMSSKLQLVKLIEENSPYKLNDDLDVERYKNGDVEFIKRSVKPTHHEVWVGCKRLTLT